MLLRLSNKLNNVPYTRGNKGPEPDRLAKEPLFTKRGIVTRFIMFQKLPFQDKLMRAGAWFFAGFTLHAAFYLFYGFYKVRNQHYRLKEAQERMNIRSEAYAIEKMPLAQQTKDDMKAMNDDASMQNLGVGMENNHVKHKAVATTEALPEPVIPSVKAEPVPAVPSVRMEPLDLQKSEVVDNLPEDPEEHKLANVNLTGNLEETTNKKKRRWYYLWLY